MATPTKTYEFLVRGRAVSADVADPALAATASAATFYVEGMTVNGVDKAAAAFSASELATLTAAIKAGVVDVLDVNTLVVAITKGAGVNAGTGDFVAPTATCVPGALAEVWTVTRKAGVPQLWTVVGATSGAKADATSGVAYSNTSISFTIVEGATPSAATDAFTVTISQV